MKWKVTWPFLRTPTKTRFFFSPFCFSLLLILYPSLLFPFHFTKVLNNARAILASIIWLLFLIINLWLFHAGAGSCPQAVHCLIGQEGRYALRAAPRDVYTEGAQKRDAEACCKAQGGASQKQKASPWAPRHQTPDTQHTFLPARGACTPAVLWMVFLTQQGSLGTQAILVIIIGKPSHLPWIWREMSFFKFTEG